MKIDWKSDRLFKLAKWIVTFILLVLVLPIPAHAAISDGFDFPVGKPNGTGYNHTAGYDFLEWAYYSSGYVYHPGEDWNGNGSGDSDLGDPVYAVSNGTVVASGNYGGGWGNIILLEHTLPDGRKVWSQYAHLRDRYVSSGNIVRGQQIGTIGKGANNQYWAHLHFEIRKQYRSPNAWVSGWSQTQVRNSYYDPSDFINSHRSLIPPINKLHPNHGKTIPMPKGDWNIQWSSDAGSAMEAVKGGLEPVRFNLVPNKWTQGHIRAYKDFATPVNSITFKYDQNWSNEYLFFQVEIDGKPVRTIDKYGPYGKTITLKGLNAKRIAFVFGTRKTGKLPYGWWVNVSNIHVTMGGFSSYFSNDIGAGLGVSQATNIPIHFKINPNKYIVGHIKSTRTFASPVDAISFKYNQNWSSDFFSFQVEADGKVVKAIDKTGPYSERITLKGLNAKKITFVLATRKNGTIPFNNWFADVSGFHAVMGNYDSYFSEAVGAGLDVSQKPGIPIHFSIKPNEHIVGHIKTSRTYASPVKAISFDYNQNWDNKYFFLQIQADGKPVASIDRYATYKKNIVIKGLNAKTISFVLGTKKTGWIPYSNWFADISNVRVDSGRAPVASLSAPRLSTDVTKKTRFKISWSGKDPSPSSGIASYDVQYKPAGKSWRNLLTNTTKKATNFKGRPGYTYYFRSRSRDKTGNVGKYTRAKRTIVPHDNNQLIKSRAGFRRTKKNSKSRYYRNTIRYSTRAGDAIVYRFTGRRLFLISTKAKSRSKARIYINGKYIKTINAYSAKSRFRQVVFKKAWRKRRVRTLRIVNVGNRRKFDVDGIGVVR